MRFFIMALSVCFDGLHLILTSLGCRLRHRLAGDDHPATKSLALSGINDEMLAPLPRSIGCFDFRTLVIPLGYRVDRRPFLFTEQHARRHCLALGTTGCGKSVLVELIIRSYILTYRAVILLDPGGDLTENLAVFVDQIAARSGCDAIRKRVHYIEVSPERVPLLSIRYQPDPRLPHDLQNTARRAWVAAEAHRLSALLVHAMGETGNDAKPRLTRVLYDVIFAVLTAVNAKGDHLPLSDALVLLSPDTHPRFDDVFEIVAPLLPIDVRSDLLLIRSFRDHPDKLFTQTEAATNRLRNLLTPLVRVFFQNTTVGVPFDEILRNNGVLLVNLRPTRYLSPQICQTLGALFFSKVLAAAQLRPRRDRQPCYIFLEEASSLIGGNSEEIKLALQQARKDGVSVTFIGQSIESFRRDNDDNIVPILLNEVNNFIVFRQNAPESRNIMADILVTPNLDFEELTQEVDRPDGYDWIPVTSLANGKSEQTSKERGVGHATGHSAGVDIGTSVTMERGNSVTHSSQHATGQTSGSSKGTSIEQSSTSSLAKARSTTDTQSHQRQHGFSDQKTSSITDHRPMDMTSVNTRAEGSTISNAETDGNSTAVTEGETSTKQSGLSKGSSETVSTGISVTDTTGEAFARSGSTAHGQSQGFSRTTSETETITQKSGSAQGKSETVTVQPVPLARHRTEVQHTGQLLVPIDVQERRMQQQIATQGLAQATVLLWGERESFQVQIAEYIPVIADPQEFDSALRAFKRRNDEIHSDYIQIPDLDPGAEAKRISDFLSQASAKKVVHQSAEFDDDGASGLMI